MEDLLNSDIFSLIFSPRRFHLQIVQRSVEVIKIYISEKKFEQPQIDILWDSTLIDETALIEVYKII